MFSQSVLLTTVLLAQYVFAVFVFICLQCPKPEKETEMVNEDSTRGLGAESNKSVYFTNLELDPKQNLLNPPRSLAAKLSKLSTFLKHQRHLNVWTSSVTCYSFI